MRDFPSLEEYRQDYGDTPDVEMLYYRTYLIQTDYVAAKLAEAVYTGVPLEQDYSEVLERRAYARQRINELAEVMGGGEQ